MVTRDAAKAVNLSKICFKKKSSALMRVILRLFLELFVKLFFIYNLINNRVDQPNWLTVLK